MPFQPGHGPGKAVLVSALRHQIEILVGGVERVEAAGAELAQINQTKHLGYRDYFTTETRTIVESIFAKDIDIGGYAF